MKSYPSTWDFTFRELEIISFIQRGNSSKEIADSLCLSVFTVKKHRENIATKIGSNGKTEFRKAIFQLDFNLIPFPGI